MVAVEATERIEHRIGVGHRVVVLCDWPKSFGMEISVALYERLELLGRDQQGLDVAVVLPLDREHLEHLPTPRSKLTHELVHVFVPVERGDDGVQLEPDAERVNTSGMGSAEGNMAAFSATELGLNLLVTAVDREANPIDLGGVIVEEPIETRAIGDEGGDEANAMGLGYQLADLRGGFRRSSARVTGRER